MTASVEASSAAVPATAKDVPSRPWPPLELPVSLGVRRMAVEVCCDGESERVEDFGRARAIVDSEAVVAVEGRGVGVRYVAKAARSARRVLRRIGLRVGTCGCGFICGG